MDYLLAIIILMDHLPKEYERKLTRSKRNSLLVFRFWFWENVQVILKIKSNCKEKNHLPKEYKRKLTRSKKNSLLVFIVLGKSSGDLLIWQNFEFWRTNICYCLHQYWLFSVCQRQAMINLAPSENILPAQWSIKHWPFCAVLTSLHHGQNKNELKILWLRELFLAVN